MKRIVLGVLATFSLSGVCHALPIFHFAFDGPDGGPIFGITLIQGTVTGTISGLQDNIANQNAGIVVEITSYPAELGGVASVGLNTSLWSFVGGPGFDVVGGVITDARYLALQGSSSGSDLLLLNFFGVNGLTFDGLATATGNLGGLGGTSYTSTPVPEPGTLTLIGASLIGLGLMSRRRKRQ